MLVAKVAAMNRDVVAVVSNVVQFAARGGTDECVNIGVVCDECVDEV